MGHDITAKRPGVDEDALYESFNLLYHDDGWLDRYNEYENATAVAYNRRSAGNPLNQVLYIALGVMDEAYGGCSGYDVEINVTLTQLKDARTILAKKDFSNISRERNLSDEITEMFKRMGTTVLCGDTNYDISQEQKFIEKCIEFLEKENLQSINISFS